MERFLFFVGHKPPVFAMWREFNYFELDMPDMTDGGFSTNRFDHRLFNEYAYLFELRRVLQANSAKNSRASITVAQHRRFVINKRLGEQSLNQSWVQVLNLSEVQNQNFYEELFPSLEEEFLIGSAVKLTDNILGQYGKWHYARDILRFVADLIDSEIISNAEAMNFLNFPVLIPSPSCGTFPLDSFLRIMEELERAAESFWNAGLVRYNDSYQSRVCSFLLERLNSYFLIRELKKKNVNFQRCFGYTTVISESPIVQRGVAQSHLRDE